MQSKIAEDLLRSLQEPQGRHRPLPFWSWNDKLDPAELRRQIRLMKKSGVGGFFMHARSGLKTEYLSDEWFGCVEAGLDEGTRTGLAPWVYDEEGWPSGFAGGKVTGKGDWTYARGLQMRRLDRPEDAVGGPDSLGVFACTPDDGEAVPLARADADTAYASYVEIYQSCSPFYIDVMNEAVVKDFIEETHDRYAARYPTGEQGLQGFFTDEPRFSEGPIPWSRLLPEEFRRRYGYDLLPLLPALYLPCRGFRKVRYDFWALANDLFVNAYMKQIGDWCTRHDCKLTGHMMMEESLYSQMTGTGGGMPFYEFMHQPGVDSLRREVSDPRIPKQVGSVAEQLGKPTVLSESYAMCGWDLNFEEMRWIAGWQFVNGVNLICQHLQAYSLQGSRKRDYPPSLFYQQTWFGEYRRFNDYIARLGQLLGEHKKHIDLLLLHPMHSGWVSYDGSNCPEIQELDRGFVHASELLSGSHIDYHLGDEVIMLRHGRILEDGALQIGAYTYRAIALPDCLTLDRSTLAFLQEFTAKGNLLIRLGRWPDLCEGEPSEEVRQLERSSVFAGSPEELHRLLDGLTTAPVRILEQGAECTAIHCCQVAVEGGTALYLVNMDRDRDHEVELLLPADMRADLLDLCEMDARRLTAAPKDGRTAVPLHLNRMESTVILYAPCGDCAYTAPAAQVLPLSVPEWKIAAMDKNALTLDRCEYAIDDGEWQPAKPVIHLMQDLLDLRRPCRVRQRFRFDLRCDPRQLSSLEFVLEQPEKFRISINGTDLSPEKAGSVFDAARHYKDVSLCRTDILPFVRQGENVVELSTLFRQSPHIYEVLYGQNVYETELNKLTYDIELESVYLVGDFGVYSASEYTPGPRNSLTTAGPFFLDLPPVRLQAGDFTRQGLTFFSGTLTLEQQIRLPRGEGRLLLDLGHPRAPLVQVRVDDGPVRTLLWPPFRLDVTPFGDGEMHRITVTLYSSNRNLFGPHHHIKQESYSVGPLSFTGKFSWAERESEAVPITPELRKQNFWQDDYSFVTFGLPEPPAAP